VIAIMYKLKYPFVHVVYPRKYIVGRRRGGMIMLKH
jgi:hypothetical protein